MERSGHRGFIRPSLKVGDTVLNGAYTITKVLAEGTGMSNVYQASDSNSSKQWALKQIYDYRIFEEVSTPRQQRKNELEFNALDREARVMGKLTHNNIPRIVAIEDDIAIHSRFIVMDLVEGPSAMKVLEKQIAKGEAFETSHAVRWIGQLARILLYLHNIKTPLVYRDIKPNNLVITPHSGVNLVDFGTAEFITEPGQKPLNAVGSQGYAPPEQKTKDFPLDPRSDIYSLGVTLAQFLTGVSPEARKDNGEKYFPEGEPFSIREIDLTLPYGLEEFVKRCTQPNIEDRFGSIEGVIEALTDYNKLDKRYIKKQKRKLHTVVGLGALSAILALGAGVSYGFHINDEGQKYNAAVSVANQSGRVDDYVTAIDLKPSEIQPYEGMITAIKKDGTFDSAEEEQLLGLINPVLPDIKEKDGYGDLAYEIGRLYWFYYQVDKTSENQGQALSTKWFEDSINLGIADIELATIYYNIGMFDKTISASEQESTDEGEYKKHWENLIAAQEAESGEIVDLQIFNTIANFIDNYSYRLKTDGVPIEEVEAEVKKIKNYVIASEPSAGTSEDLYEQLEASIDGLEAKVEIAYRESYNG